MDERRYYFYIIGVTLLWGFTAIVVRYLPLHPLQTMFFSSLVGLVAFGVWYLLSGRGQELKGTVGLSLLLGVLFTFNNSFFFMAIKQTTIANAVFAHYTSPLFAALLAPLFLGEQLEKKTILALLISMTGLFFLGYKDLRLSAQHLLGLGYGVASGLFFGLSILLIKKLMEKTTAAAMLFYQSLVPVVLLLPSVFLLPLSMTPGQLSILVGYALVMYMIGSIFFVIACKHVKAQYVGIFAYFEPLSSTLYAALLFAEIPSALAVLGAGMVVGGGALLLRNN